MSSNKGFIEVRLDTDDLHLKIQKEGGEEVFECSLTENELDWCIDTSQHVRKIQKRKKNLGTLTLRCEDLEGYE